MAAFPVAVEIVDPSSALDSSFDLRPSASVAFLEPEVPCPVDRPSAAFLDAVAAYDSEACPDIVMVESEMSSIDLAVAAFQESAERVVEFARDIVAALEVAQGIDFA